MKVSPLLYKSASAVWLLIGGIVILIYGKSFLMPLVYGGFFAMLLSPLKRRIQQNGVHNRVATAMCVGVLLLVVSTVGSLITWQATQIMQDWPQMEQQLSEVKQEGQQYVTKQLPVSVNDIQKYAQQGLKEAGKQMASLLGGAMSLLSSVLLVLVYFILILSEKDRIKSFLLRVTKKENESKTENAVQEISKVAKQYLLGKLLVMLILGAMYAVGFLLAGVKYALLIALISALLSIIPYFGNLIGGVMAVLLTLVSGGLTAALFVIGIMAVAQVLESYVLEPMIVGDKVDLNPFSSIVSVVGFSLLWGIAGAVLALPLAATARIIFNQLVGMEGWGFLLGDQKVSD